MSALLPEGASLNNVPYLWFDAVRFALMVVGFDELPSEDRPPKRIWRDGDRLEEWFKAVKRRHEAEARGESKHIEDPVDNAFIKDLIVED